MPGTQNPVQSGFPHSLSSDPRPLPTRLDLVRDGEPWWRAARGAGAREGVAREPPAGAHVARVVQEVVEELQLQRRDHALPASQPDPQPPRVAVLRPRPQVPVAAALSLHAPAALPEPAPRHPLQVVERPRRSVAVARAPPAPPRRVPPADGREVQA